MVKKINYFSFVILLIFTMILTGCNTSNSQTSGENPTNTAENKETSNTGNDATEPNERKVTDMAGRTVTLPKEINKVVLVGPVPVLSSFVLAVGEGDKIVNGLPTSFVKQDRWKYLPKFAPNLATKPIMQGEQSDPNIEEILKAEPDVVFTMSDETLKIVENSNLPAIFLSWKEPEDVKEAIKLVGEIFNKQDKAEAYAKYFDDSIAKVQEIVKDIPDAEKVNVLNINVKNFSQPHAIAEWWIKQAGGISVTDDGSSVESKTFTLEQFLEWNPDVLVVAKPSEIDELNNDSRFENINAIKDKRIFSTPLGSHIWANRTSEQPLMVMYAATQFYPEKFKDLDITQEMIYFYETFFNYKMTEDEVKEILVGK